MNGRAIASSIACALSLLGYWSCAWSGVATSPGVTNTQAQGTAGVAPDNQCFVIGSVCATSEDCCSELCQNSNCQEQSGR